jgi:hypothetical protein
MAAPAAGLGGAPPCAGLEGWLVGSLYATLTANQTTRNIALKVVESVGMTSSCVSAQPNAGRSPKGRVRLLLPILAIVIEELSGICQQGIDLGETLGKQYIVILE